MWPSHHVLQKDIITILWFLVKQKVVDVLVYDTDEHLKMCAHMQLVA